MLFSSSLTPSCVIYLIYKASPANVQSSILQAVLSTISVLYPTCATVVGFMYQHNVGTNPGMLVLKICTWQNAILHRESVAKLVGDCYSFAYSTFYIKILKSKLKNNISIFSVIFSLHKIFHCYQNSLTPFKIIICHLSIKELTCCVKPLSFQIAQHSTHGPLVSKVIYLWVFAPVTSSNSAFCFDFAQFLMPSCLL